MAIKYKMKNGAPVKAYKIFSKLYRNESSPVWGLHVREKYELDKWYIAEERDIISGGAIRTYGKYKSGFHAYLYQNDMRISEYCFPHTCFPSIYLVELKGDYTIGLEQFGERAIVASEMKIIKELKTIKGGLGGNVY
jgi:hypothetical protein